MEDNMKNFREASDLILENVYVTDELKRKTLEKCTHRKEWIMNVKLTAAFSGALIIFFGIFISLFHKSDINNSNIAKSINQKQKNSLDNESKIQETAKTTGSSDLAQSSSAASNSKSNTKNNMAIAEKNVDIAIKGLNNVSRNKSIDAVKENIETDSQSRKDSSKASDSILQNRADISNGEVSLEAQSDTSLALMPEPLTIEKAAEYFESEILIPSYIPEGFTLTDISIPDENEKCVKLKYSSSSADFEILQSKSLSKLAGTENISIGNSIAYINFVKDEKTNVITTKITWIIDNIQYSLSSTLPKDSLIKIAESINN
ncbi:hypothetical protein JOC70_000216 [Clostridium pascui]|uniref:DUF4367 domain-containing protein n=1 Tax=Clostridium pascui TaxID=46609 RepID=UPI00195882AC|nr:DUF4367 domain-containing protein [Clostridium pascui]MBM7868747.1 hypothetical protein [Clostridium pascui]